MRNRSSRVARSCVGSVLLLLSGFVGQGLAADPAVDVVGAAHLGDAHIARGGPAGANPSSTTNLAPLNVQIIVIGWAEFYGPGCYLNYGSWVITTAPTHGTISFGPIYSADACGLAFAYNTLYYTWTDTSAVAGTPDTFAGTWTSNDGKVVEPGTWTYLLAPSDLVGAVLPSSRSVTVGTTATVFATVINSGPTPATGVSIAPAVPIPAAFSYQTTDPATNLPTGNPNTPVTIPPSGSQSFVLAITPTSPFDPTQVSFTFKGTTTTPSATIVGVNTLLMSASIAPSPDVVALVATTTPGIVNIPGATGTGAFAVATANVGDGALIKVSADTGSASLPVSLSICQTTPSTGACQGAVGPSVTTLIDSGATPTFGIFVTGTGTVPFDPSINRVFVRFTDVGGVTRGATSVAVQTQ